MLSESRKPKILIVDDIPENVELIEAYLSAEPYDIITACSGKEAIQKLKEEKIDIILLDVLMPEMSGYDVCKIVKGNPETQFIPVLMLTALFEIED